MSPLAMRERREGIASRIFRDSSDRLHEERKNTSSLSLPSFHTDSSMLVNDFRKSRHEGMSSANSRRKPSRSAPVCGEEDSRDRAACSALRKGRRNKVPLNSEERLNPNAENGAKKSGNFVTAELVKKLIVLPGFDGFTPGRNLNGMRHNNTGE